MSMAEVLQTGSQFGEYRITGLIGRGSVANTYRARRPDLQDEVALKVPHSTCSADPTYRKRFLREGALGRTLAHPSIVQVLDAGELDGRPYLAMELVQGTTLAFELAGRNPMPLLRALHYVREVADALAHAHENGVIHRNLKPGHIMVVPGGRVMVMDLGVARVHADAGLTLPGLVLGSPTYSAPEAADPKRTDHRSDIYSLGIILFEMLAGHPPFEDGSAIDVMLQHNERPLPSLSQLDPDLPLPVCDLVERMCRKDPDERPPSARLLAEEIDEILLAIATGSLNVER